MGRFFGPTPNTVSGAGFFRGQASGFQWTSRGQPLPSPATQITYGNGVHVAVAAGTLWRSTNDGHTWTEVSSVVEGYQQVAYAIGNDWIVVTNAASPQSSRSLDNGVTWGALVNIGLGASAQGVASDSFGVLSAGGGSGSGVGTNLYAQSSNLGLSWTLPALSTTGTLFRQINDGTQFVASCRTVASGGHSAGVAVSPGETGTWSDTLISAADNYIFGLNFDPVSGLYIVVTNDTDIIRVATTPVGLGSATDVSTGLTDGGSNFCQIGNGNIFAFGVAGGVSRSTNGGASFSSGKLNFSGSNAALGCSYNPVTKVFVAVGQGGNVATFP